MKLREDRETRPQEKVTPPLYGSYGVEPGRPGRGLEPSRAGYVTRVVQFCYRWEQTGTRFGGQFKIRKTREPLGFPGRPWFDTRFWLEHNWSRDRNDDIRGLARYAMTGWHVAFKHVPSRVRTCKNTVRVVTLVRTILMLTLLCTRAKGRTQKSQACARWWKVPLCHIINIVCTELSHCTAVCSLEVEQILHRRQASASSLAAGHVEKTKIRELRDGRNFLQSRPGFSSLGQVWWEDNPGRMGLVCGRSSAKRDHEATQE